MKILITNDSGVTVDTVHITPDVEIREENLNTLIVGAVIMASEFIAEYLCKMAQENKNKTDN